MFIKLQKHEKSETLKWNDYHGAMSNACPHLSDETIRTQFLAIKSAESKQRIKKALFKPFWTLVTLLAFWLYGGFFWSGYLGIQDDYQLGREHMRIEIHNQDPNYFNAMEKGGKITRALGQYCFKLATDEQAMKDIMLSEEIGGVGGR